MSGAYHLLHGCIYAQSENKMDITETNETYSDLQRRWDEIRFGLFRGNDFLMFITALNLGLLVLYWSIGGFQYFMDVTGKPYFLYRYKIQKEKKPDVSKLPSIIKVVLINEFLVTFPMSVLLFHVAKWRECSFDSAEFPSAFVVIRDIVVFIFIEEVGFYYAHRGFHHPSIYKHIHKQHHEYTSPTGLITMYCHPIEHIIANLGPPMLAPIIMQSHALTMFIFLVIGTIFTINDHAGYHFPLMTSPEAHDFHHLKFNVNYGPLGLLDWLHGTDKMFREYKQFQRHSILVGLTPMSEQFPDEQKQR